MAFPTGWGRYCAVVIDADQVSGSSHSDFPVLITEDMLPSEMFDADGSYPALNGGGDIRFSTDTAGSSQLACEVVSFVTDNNPANGTAEIWVKVPTLSGSVDTTIYVWYNKSGESQPAVTDTYGRNAVWSEFLAVWHLHDGTSLSYVDSAGTESDGFVSVGTPSAGQLAFSQGISLGGTSTVGLGASNSFNSGSQNSFALSAWVKFADGSNAAPFGHVNGRRSSTGNFITVDSAGAEAGNPSFLFQSESTTLSFQIGSGWSSNDPIYMVWQLDDSTDTEYAYLYSENASNSGSRSRAGAFPIDGGTEELYLGNIYDGIGAAFNGLINEVRWTDQIQSSDWLQTEFNNQFYPSTFAAAGTPVSAGGGGVSQELAGNSSTSAVGTLGVSTEASVSVTPTGVASSSAIGTLGVAAEINASAELVGVATTSAVGTLTAEVGGGTTVSLSGVVGTSAVGTLTAAGQVNEFVDLLGNSATGAVGTLIIVTGLQVALSGNAATGAVGTLGVTAEINASATLTGVGSSGAVGVLEVTVPITASVELTGVGATGAIGTLTAVGAGQVWTEIPSVSTTWTEIS